MALQKRAKLTRHLADFSGLIEKFGDNGLPYSTAAKAPLRPVLQAAKCNHIAKRSKPW